MKQLDVDVSPPASKVCSGNHLVGLNSLFLGRICKVHALTKFGNHMPSHSPDMNFGYVTHRQTYWKRCMSSGYVCVFCDVKAFYFSWKLKAVVESLGDMGVQFWQEISNSVKSLTCQWSLKKCEETDSAVYGTLFPCSLFKLYDPTLHHIGFGTSCQKWTICPILYTYPLDYKCYFLIGAGSIKY